MKHCLLSWLLERLDVPLLGIVSRIVTSHDPVIPLLHSIPAAGPVLHFDFSYPFFHRPPPSRLEVPKLNALALQGSYFLLL